VSKEQHAASNLESVIESAARDAEVALAKNYQLSEDLRCTRDELASASARAATVRAESDSSKEQLAVVEDGAKAEVEQLRQELDKSKGLAAEYATR